MDFFKKLSLLAPLALSILCTPVKAQRNPCPQEEVAPGQVKIKKARGERFKVGIIHKETAQTIFDAIAGMESIPYKYVVDGCDVRAYLAAKEIYERWGAHSFRANLDASPNMIAETPFTAEGWVDFSRHTALAFCVADKGVVSPVVFDAAFFDGPLRVEKWRDSLKDEYVSNHKPKLYYSSMFNLNPEEKRLTSFSSSEIACAEEVREAFMKEQKKIEKGQLPYGIGRSKEVLRLNLCL